MSKMSVGKRLLAAFERRPGVFHAGLTGIRPVWKAFTGITRGSTTLGEIVRSRPMVGRALTALDRAPQIAEAKDADPKDADGQDGEPQGVEPKGAEG